MLVAALFMASASRAPAEVDLLGSWYVLIHYRDVATANPDVDRWADRVWVFSEKGSRLRWSEYPIVVFAEQEGRFGAVAGNPRSRLLHAWEPNAAQQAEIEKGLHVNQRGSKTKSLKGSVDRGYRSMGAQRSMSATTVGYQQTWSIDALATLPVLTQDDAVGTEVALASKDAGAVSSGRTRFTTTELSEDGTVLRGRFVRDEHRVGTFRMQRAGTPKGLESDGRTPNEKARDRFLE